MSISRRGFLRAGTAVAAGWTTVPRIMRPGAPGLLLTSAAPLRHSSTGPAVWRGLAGFHLIGDDVEDALPLPRGDRDIPLLISDRSFAADGSWAYPLIDPNMHTPGVADRYMNGVLGDVVLVNGAPWPRLEVSPVRYRFRLLNASNARRYRLTLEPPGSGFVQVGSDGGLLDRPIRHAHIDISPAERFDVIIDFDAYPPGTSVRLRNALDTGPAADIMRFDVTGALRRDDTAVPDQLAPVERKPPASPALSTVRSPDPDPECP